MQYVTADHDPVIRRAISNLVPSLPCWLDADDAMQVGRLAVWSKASRYDGRISESAYAGFVARAAVVDLLRQTQGRSQRQRTRRGSTSLEGIVHAGDRFVDTMADDPADVAVRRETARETVRMLNHMPPRSLFVAARYAAALTFSQIGVEMGISTSRAAQLLKAGRIYGERIAS